MTKLTVAGNAYRWVHPAVQQIIDYCPAGARDFLEADGPTRHFVALAVRGWEVRQARSARALRELAEQIFSRPRPLVLAHLWGTGFGKLSLLKRLPGRVLPRCRYDQFAAILLDLPRRQLLAQCAKVSVRELDLVAYFDQPTLAASLRRVSKIGGPLLDYIIAVTRRHRPDLDNRGLLSLLHELGRAEDVSTWLRRVLRHADLPPPPWDGTETITPLRTVAEIQMIGVELQNCLFDEDRSLTAVLGECCYYRVSGRYGPAVVAVVVDALLGAWRIESYRGPANAPVKPAAARHIVETFAAAGIGFFGEYPRERALEGLDGFHPPP